MAAVRQQQLISSGMDPTHARIHAQRAGRDAQAMGYSSSAYGSDDDKQQVSFTLFLSLRQVFHNFENKQEPF